MSIPRVFAREGMVVCAYEGNAMEKVYSPTAAQELGDTLLRVANTVRHEWDVVRHAERERIKRDVLALYESDEEYIHRDKVMRAIDGEGTWES